jgi:hypothetical protein
MFIIGGKKEIAGQESGRGVPFPVSAGAVTPTAESPSTIAAVIAAFSCK